MNVVQPTERWNGFLYPFLFVRSRSSEARQMLLGLWSLKGAREASGVSIFRAGEAEATPKQRAI